MKQCSGAIRTSNHDVRINDDHNSLKTGDRGPSLLEDFLLRETITHVELECLPGRVVALHRIRYFLDSGRAIESASDLHSARFSIQRLIRPIPERMIKARTVPSAADASRPNPAAIPTAAVSQIPAAVVSP